jgi:hypothetical protein
MAARGGQSKESAMSTDMSSERETSGPDRTPEPARKLSIGLLVWCGFGALILLGVYYLIQH